MKKKRYESKKGRVLQFITALYMAVVVFACYLYAGLDRTFSYLTFYSILGGAAFALIASFIPGKFGNILPLFVTTAYAVGVAENVMLDLETLSDVWNGVNFVGGNAQYAVIFGGLLLLGLLLQILSCFMGGDKKYVRIKVKVSDLDKIIPLL